jgi:hypothetical protein
MAQFLDFMDMINGGGAGAGGNKFEGGGILSSIANSLFSPRGSLNRISPQARPQGMGQPMMQPMMQPQQMQPQQRQPMETPVAMTGAYPQVTTSPLNDYQAMYDEMVALGILPPNMGAQQMYPMIGPQ